MQEKYIKTKDILEKYGISSVTAAKWVHDTVNGSTGLEYSKIGKRNRLLDNPENWLILDKMGQLAIQKRNSIFVQKVSPSKDFYNHFDNLELLEIIQDLQTKNIISHKFSYRGKGSEYWDNFYTQNYENQEYKTPLWTEEILEHYSKILVQKLAQYKSVNILDFGTGNGRPIIKLLQKLKTRTNLSRYIGVDISQELLTITKKNIRDNVPGLEVKCYQKDIQRDKLYDVFSYGKDTKSVNIVLLLGRVLANNCDPRSILSNIQSCMGPEDFVIITADKNKIVNNLNFEYVKRGFHQLEKQDLWIPRALSIEVDKCQYKFHFDTAKKQKTRYLILDKDYRIDFRLAKNSSIVVNLKKRSKLIVWFYFIETPAGYANLFESSNLQVEDLISHPNQKCFLISAKTKEFELKPSFNKS